MRNVLGMSPPGAGAVVLARRSPSLSRHKTPAAADL
jgi:hypothetical protein